MFDPVLLDTVNLYSWLFRWMDDDGNYYYYCTSIVFFIF